MKIHIILALIIIIALPYVVYPTKNKSFHTNTTKTMSVDTISDMYVVGLNFICSIPDSSIGLFKTTKTGTGYGDERPNIVGFDTAHIEKPRLLFYVYVHRPHLTSFFRGKEVESNKLAGVYSIAKGKGEFRDYDYWVYDYADHTQNGLTVIGMCHCDADTNLLKHIIKSIRIHRDSTYMDERHKSMRFRVV